MLFGRLTHQERQALAHSLIGTKLELYLSLRSVALKISKVCNNYYDTIGLDIVQDHLLDTLYPRGDGEVHVLVPYVNDDSTND